MSPPSGHKHQDYTSISPLCYTSDEMSLHLNKTACSASAKMSSPHSSPPDPLVDSDLANQNLLMQVRDIIREELAPTSHTIMTELCHDIRETGHHTEILENTQIILL